MSRRLTGPQMPRHVVHPKMDRSTFLFDVPPHLIERLCKILDSGNDPLGWRGLAARIVPSWLEVRCAERLEAAGKSPSRELLWSWAQRKATVAALVEVLEDMGHHWALQLFVQQDTSPTFTNEPPESRGSTPVRCDVQESFQQEESIHDQPELLSCVPHCPGASPYVSQRRVLTYDDVIEGTGHFHHDMKIAEGTFSNTYKGTLGHETFAVKLFKMGNDPSWKERWDLFARDTDVRHLSQHPNILDLLACFSEDGNHCLVYPYLPNGSLHRRLHDLGASHPLSWQQRLAIIKGTAKALHHLHTARSSPVVCGNITSGNVLLDGDLQPQLSNVGLARLRPASPRQSCSVTTQSGIHGNLGYLPPEFVRGDQMPVCAVDVYGLGVVMMETITGRKVVEETPRRSLLRDVLSGELEDGGSVDSCVRFLDQEAGSWPRPIAVSLLRLALECAAARARNRPHMETVLRDLSQLLPVPSFLSHHNQPHDLDDDDDGDPHCEELGLSLSSCSPPSSPPPPTPALPGPPAASCGEDTYVDDRYVSAGAESTKPLPCECSQSDVTFWGSCEDGGPATTTTTTTTTTAPLPGQLTEAAEAVDLYNSWPVQCSCQADSGDTGCEDCRANGFTLEHSDAPHFPAASCYGSWTTRPSRH